MELGKGTSRSIQSASSASCSRAKAVIILCATSPLPWMLSQDITVNAGVPASRRRRSAAAMKPNVVRGGAARVLEVVLDVLVAVVELAGHRVHAVAALGDGQRHDPGARVGHPRDHGLRVVRGEQVVGDRADHPRLQLAVRVLDHERVEAVLGLHHLVHPPVERQHADPADRPVQRLPGVHQGVEVHRLVRPVEPADPEVHDARAQGRAVVARGGDVQCGQGLGVEPRHAADPPYERLGRP